MKKLFLSVFCALSVFALSAKYTPSVALVVDSGTRTAAGEGLSLYAGAIMEDGKEVIVIEDVWHCPDSIRARLETLYRTRNLEGAVFIGDIPIPMIRDAQHLTTAFKMDQSRDWKESSVPSDRFYDDFDLKFDFLREDEDSPLYFYYSLRADSPQYISSDIYSARIKAPAVPGRTKHEAVDECLRKLAAAKSGARVIDKVLHFAGHGYNSESHRARTDENWVLRHHFPQLDNDRDAHLCFINYDEDPFVKPRLKAALADSDIDIAVLHHHGAEDTQYLGETPAPVTVKDYIESVRRIFRGKVSGSRDPGAARDRFVSSYGVPGEWADGVSDPEVMAADSVFAAGMDMHIQDLADFTPQARFVMLDACFNGAFLQDDYIAGHYVFGDGGTVAVKANSVNTLQDIWSTELIGLLGCGVSIGNWAKELFTLESHIIGDPTYRFATSVDGVPAGLDMAVTERRSDTSYWRRLFKKTDIPDLKALSLVMLAREGALPLESLMRLLADDPDPVVRTEAYALLKKYLAPDLAEATRVALSDSYELLSRLAAAVAVKSGDRDLLPVLVKLYFDPSTPTRVYFQVRDAFDQYPASEVLTALDMARADSPLWPEEAAYEAFRKSLERSEQMMYSELGELGDTDIPFRKRRPIVTPQRNKCQTQPLDAMLSYLRDGTDNEMRLLIAETLGWYVYSSGKERIISFLGTQLGMESDPQVKNEIVKTLNRLSPVKY